MNPDNFQQAWQTQSSPGRLAIDADLLLNDVQRNQRHFAACIFWRDVREVGLAILMVPVWICMGVMLSLPWTWYLTVPALVWIAAFLVADRMRYGREPPETVQPLRQRVESSLARVEHQIWLLRNVFWWYLLPPGLSTLALIGQITWQERAGGWLTAIVFAGAVTIGAILLAVVYRLNQDAVRSVLVPRRQELAALLTSLQDEPPSAS